MSLAPSPATLDVSPDGLAIVTLNRPDKKNAFDELMIAALREHFETLRGADHVRIVFLRGAGDAFCAGADIDWMRRQADRTERENQDDALDLALMLRALHDLPQFTVALVQGAAFGGGAGLVAACDYAIAMTDAQFRFSEVRLGIIPATISPFVIEAIGPRAARALFASAAPFGAERAYALGLVQEIAPDVNALEAAIDRLAQAAFETAPGAVAAAKKLVKDYAGRTIDERLLHDAAERIAKARASAEGREGLAAFLEKRPPAWRPGG